jgi:tRNA threonylcarbamoyladenosine biosynthesis protein TsaE
MSAVLRLSSADEAPELAAALLHGCGDRRVFAFRGELGAGKTTLIKALCAELGVEAGMSSPSFGIVNEYTASGGPVYHFDLYRLRNAADLEQVGFTEYIDSGRYCFVEWPDIARDLLPPDTVWVRMQEHSGGERTVQLDLNPAPRAAAPVA